MKIAFINGSPKKRKSVSEQIIAELVKRLPDAREYAFCNSAVQSSDDILAAIRYADAVVFVFPLYVDALPSRLVKFLEDWAERNTTGLTPGVKVYAVVNNGFFEARQNEIALSIIKSFCGHTGLSWARGLGIGAGVMISTASIGLWPLKRLGRALDELAADIKNLETGRDIFVQPSFPRFIYNMDGNLMWKKAAKKRGLKVKDLYAFKDHS